MPQSDSYLINISKDEEMPVQGSELWFDLELTEAPVSTNRIIQGKVKDENNNPVENAIVKIFYANTFEPFTHTKTNEQGQYSVQCTMTGTCAITASKLGYITPPVQLFACVKPGTITINMTLAENPSDAYYDSFYGVVTDDTTKNPIEGALVTINSINEQTGEETLFAQTFTGVTGQYFTTSLPPGNYTIQASKYGYFPNPKVNMPINEQELLPIDISLLINPDQTFGTVSGIIKDSNGTPIPSAYVALYEVINPTLEMLVAFTRTQSNGLYLFGDVPPNKTYRVKAKAISIVE